VEATDEVTNGSRLAFPFGLDFVFRRGYLARDLAKPRAETVGRVKPFTEGREAGA
jgi:hypothetical protein